MGSLGHRQPLHAGLGEGLAGGIKVGLVVLGVGEGVDVALHDHHGSGQLVGPGTIDPLLPVLHLGPGDPAGVLKDLGSLEGADQGGTGEQARLVDQWHHGQDGIADVVGQFNAGVDSLEGLEHVDRVDAQGAVRAGPLDLLGDKLDRLQGGGNRGSTEKFASFKKFLLPIASQTLVGAPCGHAALGVASDDPFVRKVGAEDFARGNDGIGHICSVQITSFVLESAGDLDAQPGVIGSDDGEALRGVQEGCLPGVIELQIVAGCAFARVSGRAVGPGDGAELLLALGQRIRQKNVATGRDRLAVLIFRHVDETRQRHPAGDARKVGGQLPEGHVLPAEQVAGPGALPGEVGGQVVEGVVCDVGGGPVLGGDGAPEDGIDVCLTDHDLSLAEKSGRSDGEDGRGEHG